MCLKRDAAGPASPWRGVNLGGWLLLEPGTAKSLFARHAQGDGREARCEWDLMEVLRRKGALHELARHRESFICREDFRRIREYGLNAVRLPIGYWVVLGASPGEPYHGPALEYVDRAVDWAEECGLQILLDLHGCPGGESGEAPCGRRQRGAREWQWRSWRFEESLRAVQVLAQRYCMRSAVSGIEVCNEPSPSVPASALCGYYDDAVKVIRQAGMESDRVAIVLPLFQRPVDEILQAWKAVGGDRHKNICFDMHYYHCFENQWNGKTLAQQLRSVQQHAGELRQFPAMVGEWSLALGLAAQSRNPPRDVARSLFGRAQLAAYSAASHGWFFWNWSDAHGVEWDWQQCFREGSLSGLPYGLPAWNGTGEDPLEEVLDPSPTDPVIRMGDTVFLRTFHGRHVDLDKTKARARWADQGEWQRFVICPLVWEDLQQRSPVTDGDTVRFLAHTGRFLSVTNDNSIAGRSRFSSSVSADFVLRVDGADADMELRHRQAVFLQSKSTSCMVDVDASDDEKPVRARWNDCGEWQRFHIEKAPEAEKLSHVLATVAKASRLSTAPIVATPQPKRRVSVGQHATPQPKRKLSLGQRASPQPTPRRPPGGQLFATPQRKRKMSVCQRVSPPRRKISVGQAKKQQCRKDTCQPVLEQSYTIRPNTKRALCVIQSVLVQD